MQKAQKILFYTYWRSGGWVEAKNRSITAEDFAYAKEKGLMFDPLTLSHDDVIKRLHEVLVKISEDDLIKAFLASLSSRDLALRSAIASYYLSQKIPLHAYTPVISGSFYENGEAVSHHFTCGVCRDAFYGIIGDENYIEADLNVLNFERLKWGGVRHGQILYMLFDLERFIELSKPIVKPEDIEILQNMAQIIRSSDDGDYPGKLSDRLKDVLKSSKAEREMLVEILAAIGLLKEQSTDRSARGKHDWSFAQYWRGEDGLCEARFKALFEAYL
ncbi:hypothetical protein MMG00_03380 [Ignatzschineria rhizosphaerae]|uniref:Uncharacterized protein n=1 Tax=Ignatzschineria rhizosphaerae TaxID=2923279 RepID=A0ABY3X783_9GAMM|nr:hypothetical protein [Ignatzschineria rhizosphaerae]UNM96907.1 hypothetical protein MMG00_03380 [Ignatzschineria rhizosphaerae]